MSTAPVEALARRERLVTVAGLLASTAAAWVWLAAGAGMDMSMGRMDAAMDMNMDMPMDGMSALAPRAWTPGYAGLMFVMWWVMMAAMMLPSAAPMILLFAAVNRRNGGGGAPGVPAGVLAAGYLLVWGAFSLAATVLQGLLETRGLLSPMRMTATSAWLGGALLLAAGVYQLTPLKRACLRRCRGPLAFIMQHWRPGRIGAMRMGVLHGIWCVGCCWLMMALLFYGGVMNLYWIAGLALVVLVEKILPYGERVAWVTGAAFVAWGIAELAAPVAALV